MEINTFFIRLSICFCLSILIGLERQIRHRMVGLRTNVLVCIGAFLFVYLSFGIDVVDLPIGEIPWKIFSTWYKSNFNPYGQDWIDWYLWERKDLRTGEILACYDSEGEKFFVETPEDLWDLVEEYVLQPCSDNKCQFKKSESCINS